MDEIRHLCRHTIDRAKGTLHGSLMFGIEHLLKLTSKDLEESDGEQAAGWWFSKHR